MKRAARVAAELVALRQREDLLELIEDQQGNERGTGFVAQHIVAMMQEFPQRLALGGDARPGSIRRTAARRG